MSIECQSCTAPSTLWICPRCVEEFAATLRSLAHGPQVAGRSTEGLLDALNDVVTRQTCLGGGSGHRKRGDEISAPFEGDTITGGQTSQGKASVLLNEARNALTTIVRDVCETRAVEVPRLSIEQMAVWLAAHVHSLACDESAGQWKRDIDGLVRKIERAVDRPRAPKFCGQCDKMIERKICGLMLYARRDAIEVTCSNPVCKTTHNVEALYNRWVNHVDYQILPRETIIGNQRAANPELHNTGIMGALDEFVHWQKFNRWIREGQLKPVRYQRANGRRGFFRHGADDIPEYRVGDVRQVNRKADQAAIGKARVGGSST